MSDADPQTKLVWERLAAKGAGGPCQACGANRWGVFRNPNGALTVTVAAGTEFPAYTVACLNCGFVRWHIAELLDGRARPEGEDQGQ
jgi:hypothetical protein